MNGGAVSGRGEGDTETNRLIAPAHADEILIRQPLLILPPEGAMQEPILRHAVIQTRHLVGENLGAGGRPLLCSPNDLKSHLLMELVTCSSMSKSKMNRKFLISMWL